MTKLQLRRLEQGLSVRKLETVSNVSRKTIIELEKGKGRKTYLLTWAKLSKALNCSIEDIRE